MVCDRHRAEPPQRRDLLGIKPRRARQAGNEHDRQRVWHFAGTFYAGAWQITGWSEKVKQSD
jgi:hypothetical protein